MLDLRVYRAAFVPALLALFVLAFSLEGRPSPARTRDVADAFDPTRAYGTPQVRDSLIQLGDGFPDRRPGSIGDQDLADRVEEVFRATGFEVTRTTDEGRTVDGTMPLDTVVGIRPGLSSRRIVVLAHRDSLDSPGLADLSGTAALLELARIFRTKLPESEDEPATGRPRLVGRDLRKTLVLVSVSGGSGGGAGARAWARAQDAGLVDGVLVLGDLASGRWQKPWVVPWSDGRSHPPLGWQRTVEAAARKEVGADPGGSRASAQWARRALPLTVGEQGEVNRAGLPGVLLQISGERGPARNAPVSRDRFTELGRTALRSVTALDEAGRAKGMAGETRPPFAGEAGGIVTLRNVLPDWSVRIVVLCLLLPALLAALDAFFRARRHRLRAGTWVGWALAAGLCVPLLWIWLRLLGIAGAFPAPRGPVLPSELALTTAEAAALASSALAVVAGIVLARALGRGTRQARGNAAAGAAGAAVGAILCAVALLVWVVNPYAAALLLPAAHIWLFLGAPHTRMRRIWGWIALAAGLVAPALVLVAQMDALQLGPFGLARMWFVATAGGHVSAPAALVTGALVGCVAALVRILLARRRIAEAAPPEQQPRTRGPSTYAGPGSLGGTESALRR